MQNTTICCNLYLNLLKLSFVKNRDKYMFLGTEF